MQFYVSICMKSLDTLENGKHLKVKIASKYPQLKCFIFSVFLSLVNQSKTIAATSFFAKKVKKKKTIERRHALSAQKLMILMPLGSVFFALSPMKSDVELNLLVWCKSNFSFQTKLLFIVWPSLYNHCQFIVNSCSST